MLIQFRKPGKPHYFKQSLLYQILALFSQVSTHHLSHFCMCHIFLLREVFAALNLFDDPLPKQLQIDHNMYIDNFNYQICVCHVVYILYDFNSILMYNGNNIIIIIMHPGMPLRI